MPGDAIRELWNAAQASGPRSDQLVNDSPFSGARPILDAFSMAADLKGNSAEESVLGSHYLREAQSLSLGDALGLGPAKRMRKLMQDAVSPPEIRSAGDSICSSSLI